MTRLRGSILTLTALVFLFHGDLFFGQVSKNGFVPFKPCISGCALLNDFLNDQPMEVLNNRSWMNAVGNLVEAEGCFTFQRIREEGVQRSVIDYGVVDVDLKDSVYRFKVCEEEFVDSDHNPIMMEVHCSMVDNEDTEERVFSKVKWERFAQEVEEKVSLVDDFEELSIESKSRCIQTYIRSAMRRVTSNRTRSESKYREPQDSRLLELLERRRKLANMLKTNSRNGSTRLEFIKKFKEYRSVRSAIAMRRVRLENERRLKTSLVAGGVGSRGFWAYLKQECRTLPTLPAVQLEDGSISRRLEDS